MDIRDDVKKVSNTPLNISEIKLNSHGEFYHTFSSNQLEEKLKGEDAQFVIIIDKIPYSFTGKLLLTHSWIFGLPNL